MHQHFDNFRPGGNSPKIEIDKANIRSVKQSQVANFENDTLKLTHKCYSTLKKNKKKRPMCIFFLERRKLFIQFEDCSNNKITWGLRGRMEALQKRSV